MTSKKPPTRRGLWAAFADAIGAILLLDALLSLLLPGHSSIAFVFFDLPDWLPMGPIWPAAMGAAILLRLRPGIVAAIALAAWNAAAYLALLAGGRVTGSPLPFSCLVAVGLVPALFIRRRAPLPAVFVAAGLLVAGHILTFGQTDYRRPGDAIVVFGAKAYDDGRASKPLYDRTMTAVRLFQQGYAETLIFSGGDNEPDVMKRIALEHGVPASAIVLDPNGVNTAATLRFCRARRPGRILAVSNSFHNARIKMLADRFGLDLVTVPAEEPRPLRGRPYYVARECAAITAYYLTVR